MSALPATGGPEPAATSLSAFQRAQFYSALHRAPRVLLLGRAGAGKTTTLCPGVEQMVESDRTGLLAFNRAVVTELRKLVGHLGRRVLVSTIDAERWSCYRMAYPDRHRLNADEQSVLVRQALIDVRADDTDMPRLAGFYTSLLRQERAVPAARLGEETAARYDELKRAHSGFDSYDVTEYLADDPARLADHLWHNQGLRKTVIDEAHDLSTPENQALALFSQWGQVVLAGDDEQAINGHRGADHEAFVGFGELEDAEVIELTVTWRSSTQLAESCLNPFRERWFPGREPLVAGNDSPVHEAFSADVVPGGEGAVFALLAAEVASLRAVPKRRATMGSIPRDILWSAPSVRAPLVGVLCARTKDVDVAEIALREFGIHPIVLRRAPLHPRTDPLLDVLLAALDPHDRTSFLGGHVDPSWAPRHLLSALAKAPARRLGARDQALVTTLLRAAAEARSEGPDAVRKALEFPLRSLVPDDRRTIDLNGCQAWAADSLRLMDLVLPGGAHGTRAVVDTVDSAFDLATEPSWSSQTTLGRLLKRARHEPDPLVAAQLLRNVDAAYRSDNVELVGPNVVLATVNQVKGLTFDFVWIVVPRRGRFPYGDPSAWDERCRWWVALTRARHLVRVLVASGVSVPYLP